ncbi:hypothetical protein WA026_019189 [Henosepilachna vigintioctopunctata]|uniref:BHLH domain-containing protein n=1 Tax=Henosepilachna vigintioctopunctata TaxID=420089 RepID=A0AAW1UWT1_9CUCU
MSSLSMITYNNTHKSILQQSVNNNNQTKDNRSVYPTKHFSKEDILLTNTSRKKSTRMSTKDNVKPNPQVLAVARRNARERNRVKQVNNGFANLRDKIPNFIAATFESGRGNNKKLSKVETLRMAVEYIKSLEELLALDDQEAENLSRTSFPSPTSSIVTNENIMNYQFSDMSASADEEMSTSSSPPPQQYVRINTATNTYEIIPAHLYEDSENFEPLSATEHLIVDPHMLGASDLDYRNVQDINLLNSFNSRDSLSPDMYSDQSFSPEDMEKLQQTKCFVPVFNHVTDNSGRIQLNSIKQEEIDEPGLVSLKTVNDIPVHQRSMINVMNWWENQTTNIAS